MSRANNYPGANASAGGNVRQNRAFAVEASSNLVQLDKSGRLVVRAVLEAEKRQRGAATGHQAAQRIDKRRCNVEEPDAIRGQDDIETEMRLYTSCRKLLSCVRVPIKRRSSHAAGSNSPAAYSDEAADWMQMLRGYALAAVALDIGCNGL